MLRKLAALMLILTLLPCIVAAESAPETILVDRINAPKDNPDFAFPEDADLLEVVFPQILDCDAALIRCGGKTMLLDCATAQQANRVTAMLKQMGVTELDYVVNTHPHADHITGLDAIAEEVTVKAFYICHSDDETRHMTSVLALCEEKGIPVVRYGDGDQFHLGDAVLDVWLKCDESCNLNERSAQIRLQYGDRTMLFTADMLTATEKALLEHVDHTLLDIDLLKYPHHGKKAMTSAFLDVATPVFAIITNNGGKNAQRGRKCLNSKHVAYANTVPGYVSCVTDGQTWLVERLAMDQPVKVTSRPDTRDFVP